MATQESDWHVISTPTEEGSLSNINGENADSLNKPLNESKKFFSVRSKKAIPPSSSEELLASAKDVPMTPSGN
jgi:hypothetical protein